MQQHLLYVRPWTILHISLWRAESCVQSPTLQT